MNISGVNAQTYLPPVQSSGGGGGENEDLKQERKAAARQSLKDSIEAFKISEQKKNIDAIR
ncbi:MULTISPECIES: type III secretion effector protein [unclassified Pseudomonas]|uniref:type III secretion effector protein n=1 Tax=unclassified Pseudomonas TaxID=196821 RepID=UPI00249CDAA7|nr:MULTISPECIES: type III secretion effector protein [unclassified Pseudomonas]MDI3248763.1 type III secretion effector protein [Pseudomonas sp. AL10]MDI3264651.1 type III secretion effector protein [Pseudomonas sp. AL15]